MITKLNDWTGLITEWNVRTGLLKACDPHGQAYGNSFLFSFWAFEWFDGWCGCGGYKENLNINHQQNQLPVLTWTGFCVQNFAMGKGDEEVITTLQKFARTVEEVGRACHRLAMLQAYCLWMHANVIYVSFFLLRILLAARGSGPHVDSKSTGSVNTEDLSCQYNGHIIFRNTVTACRMLQLTNQNR